MSLVKNPTALISTFLWIGFVCAISFMEAWLKFRAPGITISLGLGIGRLVFSALNKVELIFAIAILSSVFLTQTKWDSINHILFLVALFILLLQTFWALPVLDARAELYLTDQPVPPSNFHFYYVGVKFHKVVNGS